MARRKRPDYVAPSVRARAPRSVPAGEPAAEEQEGYFPPGTLRRVLVGGTLGALLLGGVATYVLHGQRAARSLATALTAGSCTTDTLTDPLSGPHRPDPVFRVDPPAGGTHTAEVAVAGVYGVADAPPEGRVVHALEHGYVVLWHRPDVPVEALARLQQRSPRDVLVVARPSLPVPVAATAWGHRLLCRQVEPAVLSRFVQAYVGRGPEDVARG